MIVKNEQEVLARCLNSAKKLVDEIVIVDTGSTDQTKQIAKQFTNKIFDFEWVDDFSAARNFCFSKATKDYIMWLDADDVIEPEQLTKMLELKQNLSPEIDVVMMKYDIAFDENNNPTFSYYRERIVKNNKTFFWVDPVHEVIAIHGKRIYFDAAISHKKIRANASDRNLKIYQKLIDGGAKLSARQKFYYSRELMYNQLYEQAITSFIEYLEQYNGWVENKIEACLNLASCYVNINQNHKALQWLFGSFVFDIPRAQVLCEIGHILCANKKYEQAIFWYELATKCKPNYESGAFIQKEYYDLIPYLQLCVCHYNLNNIEKAIYYNNKAHKIKPNDKAVLQNKQFFESLKKRSK